MEFKFRAGDQRPPPPQCASPRLPAVYALSKQGFTGDGCVRRDTNMIAMTNLFDTNKAAARLVHQMELILLREEKLMLEIQRQQFLNDEARRELMLFEREMAIRGVLQSSLSCSFAEWSRWGAPAAWSFNELQKVGEFKGSDRIGFGAVLLSPQVQPLMAVSKKEGQVLQADQRQLVVLEKPDPNVFREKRKAETPLISTTSNHLV